MDERFSTLNGDLMTEALMLEEFNRLVQETPSLEIQEIEVPEEMVAPVQTPAATPTPVAAEVRKYEPTPAKAIVDGTLEEMIQHFQKGNQEKLFGYLNQSKKQKMDNTLLFLDGFEEADSVVARKTSGGFFFSYEGFGVVVNPGKNFLKKFHANGRHLCEIDAVVVTRDDQEDCQDLFAIHQLNHQCNLSGSEFHLIRYFLHPSMFRKAASQLKPHFKQERNSCVSLDLFEDKETIELSNALRLTYTNAEVGKDHNLACVFELQNKKMRIGYISKAPYTIDSLNVLNGCDLLILGFEETNSKDLLKHEQLEKSLGYTGVFNLCNELGPKVAFIAEHTGSIGDVRLEIVKRMKQELAKENCSTTVFPVDAGLTLDLSHLKIQGTQTRQWIDLKNARVIQTNGPFSSLHFLSTENIL